MAQVRKDASGNLQIWTGTGWETIPNIAGSDLSFFDPSKDSSYVENGEGTGQYVKRYTGMGDNDRADMSSYTAGLQFASPDAAAKYGNLGTMSNASNNWRTEYDPRNPDQFTVLVKSDDKEGSKIVFKKDGDNWVPTFEGAQAWDTNAENNADKKGLLSVAAAAAIPYGMQELGLAPTGVANTFGPYDPVINQSLAAYDAAMAGSVAGSAAGSGSGLLNAAPGMNPSDALLYGNGEPIAGSGFSGASSGTTSFGQPFSTGATLSAAGEAGGSLLGLPNMVGVPGAVAGGAFAGSAADLASPYLGGGPNMLAPPGAGGPAPSTPGSTVPKTIQDIVKTIGPGNLIKGLLTVGGAVLGSKGADDNSATSGSNVAAVPPKTIPKMYGTGQSGPGLLGNFGPMGPTETERRMRQEYLPGLLGGRNPWGY